MRWIIFYKLNYKVFNNTHKLRPFLEKKYIENQVSNSYLVRKFINEFKLNERQVEKLYLCFRNDFYKKEGGHSEASVIALIDNFFPENYLQITHPEKMLRTRKIGLFLNVNLYLCLNTNVLFWIKN